jgi:hypothetical protein
MEKIMGVRWISWLRQAARFVFGYREVIVTAHVASMASEKTEVDSPANLICINVANTSDHDVQVVWAGFLTAHLGQLFINDRRPIPVVIPAHCCWETWRAFSLPKHVLATYAKRCFVRLATRQTVLAHYDPRPMPVGIIPGEDCYQRKPSVANVVNLR